MGDFYVQIGDSVSLSKTVSESDVYLFAGITGDFSPNHVNEEYMKSSGYGRRVAHGALLVGYMSAASSLVVADSLGGGDETPVSLGYDRIRFLKPVFLGDTITVSYTISSIDTERRRSVADIEVRNQDDELVCVAKHILKWLKKTEA
jgi:acyl dehydratase